LEAERKELASVRMEKESAAVDTTIRLALQEEEAILEQIQTTTNARRKAAQRSLERWREDHDTPKWVNARKQYEKWKVLEKEDQRIADTICSLESNTGHADDFIHVLQKTGYLTEAAEPVLTRRGIVATEFNEGHALLCTEFILGEHHKDLTADELVSILACLVEEKETDATPSIDEMAVTQNIRNGLYTLDELTCIFTKEESVIGIYSPESYWRLTTTWIEPVWRWLNGENAAQICSDYGLFEGNFVRTVLRMSNLVDELTAVATFLEDLDLLEKLKDTKQRLVRDFMVPDSLYLHL
jgi:superfamily II RNA helicase